MTPRIDEGTTHIVCAASVKRDALAAAFRPLSRRSHVVTPQWVMESISALRLCEERAFGVPMV